MKFSKLHVIVLMFFAALLSTLATFAVTGTSESQAQVAPVSLQPPSLTSSTMITEPSSAPALQPMPSVTPKKKYTLLPSGLAAAQLENVINIESGTDGHKIKYPSTEDLVMAMKMCPDNTSASAPEYLTGSYRQLKDDGKRYVGSDYDVSVTIKTTIVCLEK